jgi:bifunctional DNA-binding transcriptional regulator/antitoxin component of YhaV-PrlF toxin-antitoxin module
MIGGQIMEKSVTEMKRLTANISGVSAKIRVLGAAGIPRAEIARFLGKRYQHVRNVLEQEKASKARPAGPLSQDPAQSATAKVRLGPDGRVVIPATMRTALDMKEDDIFFARIEDGEIRLATPKRTMERVSEMLRPFVPEGVNLADELLAERRREAQRDADEGERG